MPEHAGAVPHSPTRGAVGGAGSGRCDPVRGDTSLCLNELRINTTTTANTNSTNNIISSSSSANPVAAAVPISQDRSRSLATFTARGATDPDLIPPSPPSTPPASTGFFNLDGSLSSYGGSYQEQVGNYSEHASETDDQVGSLSSYGHLRSAVERIATSRHSELKAVSLPTPDATPSTMSPASILIHQPGVTARGFSQAILPRINDGDYAVEDAGMDLVCPGWSGAVLINTRKPTVKASRSGKLSRSKAAPSHHRRTLLTMLPSSLLPSDLRTSILDVLDHATEKLRVDNVVFVLDRMAICQAFDEERFRAIVHGLCYVGASVIGVGKEGDEDLETNGDDEQEDVNAPKHITAGLVLLSVDV